jgi:HEAT repeat protein
LEPALVVPALVDNLNDPRAYIPNTAALALGEFGAESRAATPVLLDLLRNPDQTIRDSARTALAKIDPQLLESTEGEGK